MPSSPKMLWNQGNIDRLKELHAQGMSYGCIAIELHMTRNAVIGKGHRIGLQSKKKVKVLPRPKQPKKEADTAPRQPKKPPLIFRSVDANRIEPSIDLITKADDYVSMGVKLFKLEWADGRPSNCRAVLRGEGRDVIYCGKANADGSSYCPEHTKRFYAPHTRAPRPYIPKVAIAQQK